MSITNFHPNKKVQLCIAEPFFDNIELGLQGDMQYQNSSLAVHLAHYWIQKASKIPVYFIIKIRRIKQVLIIKLNFIRRPATEPIHSATSEKRRWYLLSWTYQS
jgi:hypothetical protein